MKAIKAALFVVVATAVMLMAASCETPSDWREDAQQHEAQMESLRGQQVVAAAQVEADAKIEAARVQAAMLAEQNRHSAEMYMLWTTTMAAFLGRDNGPAWWTYALAIIGGVVGGLRLGRWLERWLEGKILQ